MVSSAADSYALAMTSHSTLIPGRQFVRASILKALGVAVDPERALGAAASRWGSTQQSELIAKAAVSALLAPGAVDATAREFLQLVREASLIGKLTGLRRQAFGVRYLKLTSGSRGYWVGEGKPVPLSRPVLNGAILKALKVNAIVVTTREMTQTTADPDAVEGALQTDILNALSGALDQSLVDPSNAGSESTPPSITYGATTHAASGDLAHDIEQLISSFGGDLSAAYFIADPASAARLGMAKGANGSTLFPEAGPRGGSLVGIPMVTSREVPSSSAGGLLILVDPSSITFNLQALAVEPSTEATLEMSDSPTNDSLTPTGSTQQVSLFQTNSMAWKATIFCNWQVDRTGAVSVLEGI